MSAASKINSPLGDLTRDASWTVSSNDSPFHSSANNLTLNAADDLSLAKPMNNHFASDQAFPAVFEKSELMNEACEALLGDEHTFNNRERYSL